MKVLLTGGFGTVGRAVLEELLKQGHRVTCFDLPTKKNLKTAKQYHDRVDFFWGDLRRAPNLFEIIKVQDAVIHLAAILPPFSETSVNMAEEVNVKATRLIIAAIENSPSQPLFIFTSSVSVYGPDQREGMVTAQDPVMATDNYTEHKLIGEDMTRRAGMPWVIVRLGAVIAVDDTKGGLDSFAMLISKDPNNRVEYLHPADAALAMVNALTVPEAQGKTLLLGGGVSCQVLQRDLVQGTLGALGVNLPDESFGEEPFYTHWMDTQESQRLLNYQTVSFADFQEQAQQHYRWIRRLLSPIRPIVRWALMRFCRKAKEDSEAPMRAGS